MIASEASATVIGVDDDFHRIADVIQTFPAQRLGIGEPVAGRISILYPKDPTVADDRIGVLVETEKRGDRLNAFGDVATEKNAALTRNGAGEQDVGVVEIPGEE